MGRCNILPSWPGSSGPMFYREAVRARTGARSGLRIRFPAGTVRGENCADIRNAAASRKRQSMASGIAEKTDDLDKGGALAMRRVVITGTGMVSPLGCGTEVTWERLLAGQNGARLVTEFEVEDLPAKIACRIPVGDGSNGTFNADDWMEPKEQRKIDPFILYGMAAADMALADADWHPETDEDQIATGVLIGSGIGGLEGIVEAGFHSPQAARPESFRGNGLLDRRTRYWRRRPADRAR
ncbi:hypothetical protein Lal_00012828 [Lupinus albus]|nr:hypothetical protein Lal_00012828 [Lupinus albus]